MSYDVFISYSSQDTAVADVVCAAIELAGIRCWIAPRDISPGKEWAEAILSGINVCRVMVLVFSSHANLSSQVKREVERAVNRSIPILPIKVDQTLPSGSLEYFIMTSHWLDASTPPIEDYLGQLTHSVSTLLKTPRNEAKINACQSAPDPIAAIALRHCETYENLFTLLGNFYDDSNLPRENCGINRHTCDLESERRNQKTSNPLDPRRIFAEADLIDQLASRTMRRLWVLGGGGIGKTEFSKLCALKLAQKFKEQPTIAVLPVRIELKSLDPAVPCNSPDRLLRNHLIPDETEWIRGYLQTGRVAFILDGMDELRLDRQSFNDALLKLIQQWRECIFVITGRGDSIEPELAKPHCFDRDTIHVLRAITLEQATTYINAFFSFNERNELVTPLVKLLEEDTILQDLVCNTPLLLSMASQVYLEKQQLTSNPLDLIEKGLEVLYERRRSRFKDSTNGLPEDAVCMKTLSCLAAYSFIDCSGSARKGSMTFSRQDAIAWLRANRDEFSRIGISLDSDDAARRLLLQLTPDSGVLSWSSRDTITFSHRVLIEYFVARWIVEAGYPHWPYREHAYTLLPDILDRQIADFYGNYYWSLEFFGIRYWMLYLLERHKPSLLEMLTQWQQRTITTLGRAVPQTVFIPDDLFCTMTYRLLNAAGMLRRIGLETLADKVFDALAEEIGFDTVAKYVSQWTMLELSSKRCFSDILKFCYSVKHNEKLSELAYAVMPSLLRMFEGVSNVHGELLTSKHIWDISLFVSLNIMIEKENSGSLHFCNLLTRRTKFQLSEVDKQALIECLEDPIRPSMEFRLMEILFFLISNPPKNTDIQSLLNSLQAKHCNNDSFESNLLLTAKLLYSAFQSDSSLIAELTDNYLGCSNEEHVKRITKSLRYFLELHQPSVGLLENLCTLPEQLLAMGHANGAAADKLATTIAEHVASSKDIDDRLAELMLVRLCEKFDCKAFVLGSATSIQPDSELFNIARDLVVESLDQTFWDDDDKTLKKLEWLNCVDPIRYQESRDQVIQRVDVDLYTDQLSRDLAAKIFRAQKTREFIELPVQLFSLVEALLIRSIEEFARDFSDDSIWEQFEREMPDWNLDETFVSAVSGLYDPRENHKEFKLLALILGYVRKRNDGVSELTNRIVERLCKTGIEHSVTWVQSEPIDEVLTNYMLSAIRIRTGKSLLDGDEVIKIAATRWSQNAEMRNACIHLVTLSVNSAVHISVLERAGKELIAGWPGDLDVLRVIIEADLGSLINEMDVWRPWLMFWENEDSTTWLPECQSGFQQVPIHTDSVRGSLVVCLREDTYCGLPSDLTVE